MPATIYNGLRAYWKFDDSAAMGKDSSGYDHVGTLSSAGYDAAGKIGGGLRTSAAGGKMTVADTLAFRQFPTTRISVSVWINLDKALNAMWGTPTFLDKTGGTTRGYFLGVLAGGGNVVSFKVHNSAGTAYTASYTESATTGWVHIVGVYEGSLVRIYRNGVSQSTTAADGTLRHSDADPVDSIGLGFEGVIDELSVWAAMLTSGEVTGLYNSGNALALEYPDLRGTPPFAREALYRDSQYDARALADVATIDYANPIVPDDVPMVVYAGSNMDLPYSSVSSPYAIRDSPKRIYLDPFPTIVSVNADSSNHITAIGNGGPTDAEEVITWWEIELLPGQVFVVAERNAYSDYEVNHNQTDQWDIPLGQDWRGLTIRFWIQAVADGSQVWSSDPFTLTGDNFGNAPINPPTYTNPALAITAIDVDGSYNVTISGNAGPTNSENIQTWWEVDVSGTGEFRTIADIRFPVVAPSQISVTDTWHIPLGINLNGKAVRMGARAEFDLKQVWYSSPVTMVGAGYDHAGLTIQPLPPGPSLGPPLSDTRGKQGPGVFRVPVRDNSRR
ncbi:MAG: LamG domain-containing protein [Planctomycetes bacterium]|nr:LamG domain-containing protein [Planctomycetota bacterium]